MGKASSRSRTVATSRVFESQSVTSGIRVKFLCTAEMSSEVTTTAQENAAKNQGNVKRVNSKNMMSSFKHSLARVELTMES